MVYEEKKVYQEKKAAQTLSGRAASLRRKPDKRAKANREHPGAVIIEFSNSLNPASNPISSRKLFSAILKTDAIQCNGGTKGKLFTSRGAL
jgi:hypothetical protein